MEYITRGQNRSWLHSNYPLSDTMPIMYVEDSINSRISEHPGLNECRCSASLLFRRLKNELNIALNNALILRQDFGCSQSDSHIPVMTTAVKDSLIFGGIINARTFFHCQGIQTGSYSYCRTLVLSSQESHYSCSSDTGPHF